MERWVRGEEVAPARAQKPASCSESGALGASQSLARFLFLSILLLCLGLFLRRLQFGFLVGIQFSVGVLVILLDDLGVVLGLLVGLSFLAASSIWAQTFGVMDMPASASRLQSRIVLETMFFMGDVAIITQTDRTVAPSL